ncbi:Gustatory receptor 7b [Ladona fulva]|uniref:Gustatory receptor n=1 Tax=Ladona fulva TaxID=123851 RepID=A0A8K0P5Y9_LADFU|nr:Gustatory receptor 7b [Ladona fulva]
MRINHFLRMAKENGISWALSPMLTINAISGIPAFSFKQYGSSYTRWRVYYIGIYVTLSFLFCFSLYLTIRIVHEITYFSKNTNIAANVRVTWAIYSIFSVTISGYLHFFRRRQVEEVFQGLSRLVIGGSVERIRTWVYIQVVAFLSFVVNFVLLSGSEFDSLRPVTTMDIFTTPVIMFWGSIHMEQEWQFYNILSLLRLSTKELNFRVRSLVANLDLRFEHRTHTAKDAKVLRQLLRLRELQLKSYYIFKRAMSIYGIANMILSGETLISLAFLLFSAIDSRIFGHNETIPLRTICSIYWIVCEVSAMISVVAASECLHKEVERTEKLVIDAMLKVEDYPLRRELRLFALQLLHTPFRSSACGFFPLDLTLFTSMMATVVTYLVILVQFKSSE